MAFDPAIGTVILYVGGLNGAETWSWSGMNWHRLSPKTSPPPRSFPTVAYDATSGKLVEYGGVCPKQQLCSDTWAYSGSTWSDLKPSASPGPRAGESLVFDPRHHDLVFFGGDTGVLTSSARADTWVWTN